MQYGIAQRALVAVLIPRASLGTATAAEQARPVPAPAAPFTRMSPTQRIALLLERTPAHLGPDLAAEFKRMITLEALAGIAAAFAVLLAAQFVGVGELADAALAWWAYTQAGFSGVSGLYHALRAVVAAVRAPDEATFDQAVVRFAAGLSVVGLALLTAVVTRAARKSAGGAEDSSAQAASSGAKPLPARSAAGQAERAAAARSTVHEVNGYTFRTDSQGRAIFAGGRLKNVAGSRNPAAQRLAGGADRLATDEGGHLIATRFDGPGDAINLVPQNANLNRSAWKIMENKWARALDDGKTVDVSITPTYEGTSTRPDTFDVEYTISGEDTVERTFENQPGG